MHWVMIHALHQLLVVGIDMTIHVINYGEQKVTMTLKISGHSGKLQLKVYVDHACRDHISDDFRKNIKYYFNTFLHGDHYLSDTHLPNFDTITNIGTYRQNRKNLSDGVL